MVVTVTPRVDSALVERLTRMVQDALVAEATARMQTGRAGLSRAGQEVLADKVLRRELERVDAERLNAGVARLSAAEERVLVERVSALSVGLGPVELVLADAIVEEVVATRFDLVFVYRSDGSVELLDERLWATEAELVAWLAHLARTAGRTERQFNSQVPLLVMRLGEGLRLAATRDVSQHVSFALRRNTMGDVSVADLVARRMMPPVLAEFLAACMRAREIRAVFSGPTGAGKSTLLRACVGELGPTARVVTIEDTAELDVFDAVVHPNVESWEARLANNEGEGAITAGEQVKHALRYRPDWLVFGEVRDSDAAVPMVKAMTHGQASLTTVHSATAAGALDKLALYLGTGEDRLPPEVAHNQLHQALDFVVHLDRLADGRRVVVEVVEVAGFDGRRCTTNTIAERDPMTGETVTMNRLGRRHLDVLARAGFDASVLGGGFR
jgi:pilus assembly protein CpaF